MLDNTPFEPKLIFISILILISGCTLVGVDEPGVETPKDQTATVPLTDEENSPIPTPTTVVSTESVGTQSTSTPTAPTTVSVETKPTENSLTSTSTSDYRYRGFAIEFNDGLETNSEIPIRIRGYGTKNKTWYVVVNTTSPLVDQSRHDAEWLYVSNAFAAAVAEWEEDNWTGKIPEEMQVLDIGYPNRSTKPGTYTVKTKWATEWANGTISIKEYHSRWQNTTRAQTQREQQIANQLDNTAPNRTYHDTDD